MVSLVVALVAGCGVVWWIYADRETRQHDAAARDCALEIERCAFGNSG